jgi:salicylate hydroxylase
MASEVLERRAQFAEAGAGIQLGPNGTRVLAWLGVLDLLRPYAAAPMAIEVHDGRGEGRLLASLPLGDWIFRRHGSPYWVVRREDLHAVLLTRALSEPLIRLTMDAPVARLETAPAGGAEVIATDGRRWSGDGVVAADGAWSTLRAGVDGSLAPKFAGKAAARALVPTSSLPDAFRRAVVGVWMQPGCHVVHYPVSAGDQLAIVVIGRDDATVASWSRPAPAEWVGDRTRTLAAPIREVLAMAATWHLAPLLEMGPLKRFDAGNLALVGDAAHPVMPFLAQGGVMALEDAATLAMAVAAVGDVATAFRAYSDARTGRTRRVAEASRANGAIYHLSGIGAALRNATLGALPGARVMARYDWLYGARIVD